MNDSDDKNPGLVLGMQLSIAFLRETFGVSSESTTIQARCFPTTASIGPRRSSDLVLARVLGRL